MHYIKISKFETDNEAIDWAKEHIKPDKKKPMLIVSNEYYVVDNQPRCVEEIYIEIAFDFSFDSVKEAIDWMEEHIKQDNSKTMSVRETGDSTITLVQGMAKEK